ncbi:hypothetical protein MF271_19025 (plasmid) [Deinococcus sp. KNUC1210]|uniref:AAA family ATPase n=1 Tax=Deinococcus sp. KNUC1210 TaxID=2917691 RepID=UPI001EF13C45|nr:AAA family ATPase [Deinococcus sp. KNUC1210]ULH17414.1 hypothetical protein MF271_19025 [Deinococcus sp. KNUC1210]
MSRAIRLNPRFALPQPLPTETQRPHLLDLLGRPVRAVFFVAPSGYGKSVVLAQWARQQGSGVLWLRLREDDQDPRSLLTGIAEAARLAAVALDAWDALPPGATREQRIDALADDLNAAPENLTLILDGGDHLSAESARAVLSLLDRLGDGHRLMVAQHAGSHLSAAPLVASGQAMLIGPEQLALTPDETAALAQQLRTGPVDAHALQAAYAGWPAPILLTLYSHTQPGTPSPAELIDHLLLPLPSAVQTQLPALSVLEHWSEAQAHALGLTLPSGWLGELLRLGLPITRSADASVPHDLLRQVLDTQLQAQPERFRALHVAQGVHEATSQPYRALRHFLAGGRPDLAVPLAEALVSQWYRAADWQLALTVLTQFPQAALSANLRALLGLARLETGDADGGLAILLAQDQDGSATATSYFGLTIAEFRRGRVEEGLAWVAKGLPFAHEERDCIQLLRSRASLLVASGRPSEALAPAEEGVQRAEALGEASLSIATLTVLAYVYDHLDQSDRATEMNERAYQVGLQARLPHRIMPTIHPLTLTYLSRGELARAETMVQQFLHATSAYPLGIAVAEMALGLTYLVQGRTDLAITTLEHSLTHHLDHGTYSLAAEALNLLVDALRQTGRQQEARALYHRVYGLYTPAEASLSYVHRLYTDARLLFAEGQPDLALALVEQVLTLSAERQERAFYAAEQFRAEVLLSLGRLTHEQLLHLSETYLRDGDTYLEATYTADVIQRLFAVSTANGWDVPMFRAFFVRHKAALDTWYVKPRLQIETLGRRRLLVNGQPLDVGSAGVELLAYLVLHAASEGLRRQDHLAATLWEDAELVQARQSLRTARSVLNKAVRQLLPDVPEVVITGGRGVQNSAWRLSEDVEIKLDALESLRETDPDKLEGRYATFLPESESTWAVDQRRVIQQHVAAVLARSAEALDASDPDTALRRLVRAAELAQTVELFTAVRAFGTRHQVPALVAGAERALAQASEGETPLLSQLLN